MRVPLGWLSEWVDLPVPPEELAERLTLIGLEIDEIERHGPDLSNIQVGYVDKHGVATTELFERMPGTEDEAFGAGNLRKRQKPTPLPDEKDGGVAAAPAPVPPVGRAAAARAAAAAKAAAAKVAAAKAATFFLVTGAIAAAVLYTQL